MKITRKFNVVADLVRPDNKDELVTRVQVFDRGLSFDKAQEAIETVVMLSELLRDVDHKRYRIGEIQVSAYYKAGDLSLKADTSLVYAPDNKNVLCPIKAVLSGDILTIVENFEENRALSVEKMKKKLLFELSLENGDSRLDKLSVIKYLKRGELAYID